MNTDILVGIVRFTANTGWVKWFQAREGLSQMSCLQGNKAYTAAPKYPAARSACLTSPSTGDHTWDLTKTKYLGVRVLLVKPMALQQNVESLSLVTLG